MTVRVLVIEDHELLADSIASTLSQEGYEVTRPPDLDVETVVESARTVEPQVVLLDLRLADDRTALPMIAPLRELGASVLMVTGETDRVVLAECVEAGAIGLVHKSAPLEELVEAVAHVAELRTTLNKHERDELLQLLRDHRAANTERFAPFEQLTRREQQVLTGLIEGMSAEAIAERDFVSIATVRSQIRSVLAKLGVSSQLAAVALVRAAGWEMDRDS